MHKDLLKKVEDLIVYMKSQEIHSQKFKDLRKTILASQQENDSTRLNKEYLALLRNLVINRLSTTTITPLMYAVQNKKNGLMEDILACPGVDVDETCTETVPIINHLEEDVAYPISTYGYTALMFAVAEDNFDAVQSLIRAYANVNHETEFFISVWDVGLERNCKGILELLNGAMFTQTDKFCWDLIDCKNKEDYQQLLAKQTTLGLTKTAIVQQFLVICSEHYSQACQVLNQALEYDEYGTPSNPLAEFMATHQDFYAFWKDMSTLYKIHDRLALLEHKANNPVTKTSLVQYKKPIINPFYQAPIKGDYTNGMKEMSDAASLGFK